MKAEILTASQQIVAAGANSMYQGIVLALLVGVGLRLCSRTNAATRHAIWFTTLLLVVSLFPAHVLLGFLGAAATNPTDPSAQTRFASSAPSELTKPSESAVSGAELTTVVGGPLNGPSEVNLVSSLGIPDPELSAAVNAAGTPVIPALGTEVIRSPSHLKTEAQLPGSLPAVSALHPNSVAASATPEAPPGQPERHWWAKFLRPLTWNIVASERLPRSAGFWLLSAWLMAGGLRVGFRLWRLWQLRELKAQARPAAHEMESLFQQLRQKLAVNRLVHLKVSSTQRTPVLLGFVHPVIILPDAAGPIDLEETEHILRHELAHVARRDDWANLIQHLIQAAVFFHPAVDWISRQLSLEREIACDDCVLEQAGRPRTYALILANLAGRIHGASPLLAPGVSTSKSQLQQRINMILNTRRNASPRLAKTRLGFVTSAAALAAFLVLCTGPRLVLAQSQPATGSTPAASAGGSSSGVAVLAGRPATPPAPPAVNADLGGSPDQPAADVARGPKAKPESDSEDSTHAPPAPPMPGQPALPVPPIRAVPATPPVATIGIPTPPAAPRAPMALIAPGTGYAPAPLALVGADTLASSAKRPTPKPDASIEERLERVERMLEKLMAQQNPKQPRASKKNWNWAPPGEKTDPLDSDAFREPIQRQMDRAAQQLNRAHEQMDQAQGQQERAANKRAAEKDASLPQAQKQQTEAMQKEAFQKQVQAFQRARESLQREMEKLDRQIERLQRDHELLKEKESSLQPEQELMEEAEPTAAETVRF